MMLLDARARSEQERTQALATQWRLAERERLAAADRERQRLAARVARRDAQQRTMVRKQEQANRNFLWVRTTCKKPAESFRMQLQHDDDVFTLPTDVDEGALRCGCWQCRAMSVPVDGTAPELCHVIELLSSGPRGNGRVFLDARSAMTSLDARRGGLPHRDGFRESRRRPPSSISHRHGETAEISTSMRRSISRAARAAGCLTQAELKSVLLFCRGEPAPPLRLALLKLWICQADVSDEPVALERFASTFDEISNYSDEGGRLALARFAVARPGCARLGLELITPQMWEDYGVARALYLRDVRVKEARTMVVELFRSALGRHGFHDDVASGALSARVVDLLWPLSDYPYLDFPEAASTIVKPESSGFECASYDDEFPALA